MLFAKSFHNFARAKVDHDLQGRYDLPIYESGADIFENFLSDFKGNIIYRTGFLAKQAYEDVALIEFKFNDQQNYILVLAKDKMRFLSYDVDNNFGWVLDGIGDPLEIVTPYTLEESKEIALGKPSQNFDVMIFTHNNYPPYKLKRESANLFTLLQFARKDDPFGLTYDTPKSISGLTLGNPTGLKVTAHGYSDGDMVKITGVGGTLAINDYTARVTVIDPDNITVDVDSTSFNAYTSGGKTSLLLTSDNPALNLFYDGRLYYAATTLYPTTLWGSESAFFDIFTRTIPAVATTSLKFTLSEISQKILWLFAGENSMLAGNADGIVPINGGSVNTAITAATVSGKLCKNAPASANVYPIQKDKFIFYVGKNGRNVYFFNYDLLAEAFQAQDANYLSYDISEAGFTKIRHLKDRDDLLYFLRADGTYCTLNFNEAEKINGWNEGFLSNVSEAGVMSDIVQIVDNLGAPKIFACNSYNSAFYIEQQAERIEFKRRYKFFSGTSQEAKDADDEAYNRYQAEQLRNCIYLDNALTYSDLKDNIITFDEVDLITATSSVFDAGDIGKHIVYKTATGYESGRFLITDFIDDQNVTVEVLQTPTSNTYQLWYLTFKTLSGLTQYIGTTVAAFTDGSYEADYDISGDTLDLEGQTASVVIGYRYRALYKSFCLGFQLKTENTQVTTKGVTEAHMRLVASGGGLVGTDPYSLQPVQQLTQGDLNYLPPKLIDGTIQVDITDDNDRDKSFYISQEIPSPFCLNFVMLVADYNAGIAMNATTSKTDSNS